jgi:putative endonuclease
VTGITRRVWEHRERLVKGFTNRYGLKRLILAESYEHVRNANPVQQVITGPQEFHSP